MDGRWLKRPGVTEEIDQRTFSVPSHAILSGLPRTWASGAAGSNGEDGIDLLRRRDIFCRPFFGGRQNIWREKL